MTEPHESIPVETWTPADAKLALKSNEDNYRNLKPGLVERYARDMKAGRWHFTADPIKFDRAGQLADGQHRLTAQIEAGVTLRWAVARDLAPESTMVIDVGKPRSAADHLHRKGYLNGVNLAATARLIIALTQQRRGSGSVSTAEISALIDSDPQLVKVASELINTVPGVARIGTKMVVSYVWWRLAALDPYRTEEFMRRLESLDNLPLNSPILALHRRLSVLKSTKGFGIRVRDERIATFFHAWNAWVRNEPRELLRTVSRKDGTVIIPEPVKPRDVTFSAEQGESA